MVIPDWLAPIITTGIFALQAWTLTGMIELKIKVAAMAVQLDDLKESYENRKT